MEQNNLEEMFDEKYLELYEKYAEVYQLVLNYIESEGGREENDEIIRWIAKNEPDRMAKGLLKMFSKQTYEERPDNE